MAQREIALLRKNLPAQKRSKTKEDDNMKNAKGVAFFMVGMIMISACESASNGGDLLAEKTSPPPESALRYAYGMPDDPEVVSIFHWARLSGQEAEEAQKKATDLMSRYARARGI